MLCIIVHCSNKKIKKGEKNEMCRIVKGNTSIFPNGNLFYFVKLNRPVDVETARELQKHSFDTGDENFLFDVYKIDGVSYAGPFATDQQVRFVQQIINSRANQLEKLRSREKEVPHITKFLQKYFLSQENQRKE